VLPYLDQRRSELWVTSSLVVCEFFRPATRRQSVPQAQAWLGQVLDDVAPFEESAGLEAARVEASLSQQGRSLGMRDLLIASQARDLGATFVTFDKGNFRNQPVRQLLDVDVIDP